MYYARKKSLCDVSCFLEVPFQLLASRSFEYFVGQLLQMRHSLMRMIFGDASSVDGEPKDSSLSHGPTIRTLLHGALSGVLPDTKVPFRRMGLFTEAKTSLVDGRGVPMDLKQIPVITNENTVDVFEPRVVNTPQLYHGADLIGPGYHDGVDYLLLVTQCKRENSIMTLSKFNKELDKATLISTQNAKLIFLLVTTGMANEALQTNIKSQTNRALVHFGNWDSFVGGDFLRHKSYLPSPISASLLKSKRDPTIDVLKKELSRLQIHFPSKCLRLDLLKLLEKNDPNSQLLSEKN